MTDISSGADTTGYYWILLDTMGYYGILLDTTGYYGIPYGILWDTMGYYWILWDTMKKFFARCRSLGIVKFSLLAINNGIFLRSLRSR